MQGAPGQSLITSVFPINRSALNCLGGGSELHNVPPERGRSAQCLWGCLWGCVHVCRMGRAVGQGRSCYHPAAPGAQGREFGKRRVPCWLREPLLVAGLERGLGWCPGEPEGTSEAVTPTPTPEVPAHEVCPTQVIATLCSWITLQSLVGFFRDFIVKELF